MGQDSHIQWTDATWNPVTGCSKVSPGCAHCYAERLAPRVFAGQFVSDGDQSPMNFDKRPRRFTDVRCHPERLEQPLRWRKPRRIFVNSMSDLFHEDVPDDFIVEVWARMALTPQHTFQILTKRPHRMRNLLSRSLWPAWVQLAAGVGVVETTHPLPNVWLGVSVEDQRRADERIPVLLDTPAAVRFLSCEPLLGPVDLDQSAVAWWARFIDEPPGAQCGPIDWIIVGGESGPKARPMDLAWARSLVEQGRQAGVPVFVKQLGRSPIVFDGITQVGRIREDLLLHHRAGGDPEEWPADLRVREFPEVTRG